MNGNMGKPHGKGHSPGMTVEKAKNFKGTIKQLISYIAKYRFRIFLVILFAIASTAFSIIGPKILGKATTKIFEGLMSMVTEGGGIDFAYIANILFILLALYIVSAVFSYINGYIMTGISMNVTYELRNEIAQKINRMPLSYFDKVNNGEVLSRITNDVDTLSQTLNQSVTQIITSITTLIGILIMMITISWQMTLVAVFIIPLSSGLILFVVKKSQKYFKQQQEYLGHVNGHIEEMYGGHTVIKAFNMEQSAIDKFDAYNENLYSSAWKSQFLSGMMMPIMNFVSNLGYVLICILGGYMVVNNGLAIGDIQAFVQYVRQFTQPIAQIANVSNVLQQTAAAAERVFEFLGEDEEVPESSNPVRISYNNGKDNLVNINGSVQFSHVHFGYNPNKTIINDFSADIKQGQKVAIVGPTGAGKTTIVKLLMRFYDVNRGTISIDGYDIKDFTRNELRSLFGMVLQDTWLYNASIKDNIRYGKIDSTDEEVIEAAKAAQVDHFVRTLPEGYNMEINEDSSNISQGQKQLLTIARAILSEPKILILDEATSSVDTRTEVLIQKAMDNLMRGRTSFIIAHRLSTIRDADLILVMNNGDIVEQGTHEELLSKGGFYSSLYNSQFDHE